VDLLQSKLHELALGLNYAITPKEIPVAKIIASTETTARQLDIDAADKLRAGVSKILQSTSHPQSNLPNNLRRAANNLRKDQDIVILPADKGNVTVVMNKGEYTDKILSMLDDGTYKKLKGDPTCNVERKITKMLTKCEKDGYITRKHRLYLQPNCSTPPQLYGLPKVHKANIPLRPIVSTIGSPVYRLSKMLARILTPLSGKTESYIKNSTDFAKKIHDTELNENDKLVSFDVVSLFTRVPVTEAIEVISRRLLEDETLDERTVLPPGDICSLTNMCIKSTYFQFGESFYEQLDGAAMGSPLSPIVANIYMEELETMALNSTIQRPRMWRRYVDDTFVIWPYDDTALRDFHQHLNKQNPAIQFTIEEETEGKIPFLDVLVTRDGRRMKTSVYRKPTHTGRYINYSSHHHPRVMKGVIQRLRDRAHNICDEELKHEELKHLERVFTANGYPKPFTRRTLNQSSRRNEQEPPVAEGEEEEKKKLLLLPYIKGVSENIDRVCAPLGVRSVFKSHNTLRQLLMRVKSKIPDDQMKGVVYEVPCADCNGVYIGETGRNLKMRLKEHRYAVRRQDEKNGIAVHAQESGHNVDWEAARVMMREEHLTKRKVLESILILESRDTPTWMQG
jgi:hypothetical protein